MGRYWAEWDPVEILGRVGPWGDYRQSETLGRYWAEWDTGKILGRVGPL